MARTPLPDAASGAAVTRYWLYLPGIVGKVTVSRDCGAEDSRMKCRHPL